MKWAKGDLLMPLMAMQNFAAGRFLVTGTFILVQGFLRTNFYRASKAINSIAPYLLFEAAEPPFSAWEKVKAMWHGIDNTNTNIHRFNRQRPDKNGRMSEFVAMSDFWQTYAFNASTLRTVRRIDAKVPGGTPFGSRLPLPSSSHPIREYGTKNFISYVSIMNPLPLGKNSIRVVRMVSARVRKLIKEIPVDRVPYMHSFGLSRNYALIFAAPLYINIPRLMQNAEPVNSLDWFHDKPMVVYAVNIHTGDTTALETQAVFPMHNMNAFEDENGLIHADAVTYPDLQFMKALEMDVLKNKTARDAIPSNALLKRFTIDVKEKTIKQTPFSFTPSYEFVNYMDMPNINEDYRHMNYCFAYGLALKSDRVHLSNATIVKKNVCKPNSDTAWYQVNHYPTEPWFVPKPGGETEDDGILFSLILDGERKTSYLGILDARTMKLINKSYLSEHIPFTLHGSFFPDI